MLPSHPWQLVTAGDSAAVEAARYALLRRLAPSMRHHLVVNLQPIGMVCEVLERRLTAPAPDLGALRQAVHKVGGFNRAALASVQEVLGWLAPDPEPVVGADEAARECAGLLATSLGFRGYALRNEVHAGSRRVRLGAVRTLLSALLIYQTDHAPAPAELTLQCEHLQDALLFTLRLRPTPGAAVAPPEPIYRKLTWADLEALAREEGAELLQDGPSHGLRLPWAA